ncbi:MAG: DUF1566 domain-containing protein [Proteobacteria bacterium]|nr:DUF1566 domain-containing protein [Pseudomonadota bacterium]MBU1389239.1 DUF1566 domain-containing protein [Pseudomonadota bacterium]MBU1544059.1 DUF1566 domain-containing protein [Pseudomonadota bacterium]MBU2482043.1 DUF1566 domain-containing protein [Pseudomonadota bacterium]
MKQTVLYLIVILLLLPGASTQSQAALSNIGTVNYTGVGTYNLIYDSDQELIWLDYTHERVDWEGQVTWSNSLNTASVLTYSIFSEYSVTWEGDWRLPAAIDERFVSGNDGTTSGGYGITSSEMGYLFHVSLGNLSFIGPDGLEQEDSGLKDKDPFVNLTGGGYWSGTEYEYATNLDGAWNFYFGVGYQGLTQIAVGHYGIAVRSAEVSIVPLPSSISFLIIGLIGISSFREKS